MKHVLGLWEDAGENTEMHEIMQTPQRKVQARIGTSTHLLWGESGNHYTAVIDDFEYFSFIAQHCFAFF